MTVPGQVEPLNSYLLTLIADAHAAAVPEDGVTQSHNAEHVA